MKGKRVLQSLLVLCMTLFLAPAVVHAAGEEAQIGGKKYATLEDAIGAANAGDTVQLLKDVNVAADFIINKKITITGKNSGTEVYKITVADYKQIVITETGKLTVQDILITGNCNPFIPVQGAFTMQSGTTIENPDAFSLAVTEKGTFTMNGGTLRRCYRGVDNEGTFTMNGGTIQGDMEGVYNSGTFMMNGGTIHGGQMGMLNKGTFAMNGGTIRQCTVYGVVNLTTFTMNGGTIRLCDVGVVNNPQCLFTMTAGKIVNSGHKDVFNGGTFIRTRGDAQVDIIYNDPGCEAVYKEVDPVRKPDSQWKPVTPEEKRSFACRSGEPVNYTAAKENTYEVIVENALQGPKCFASFDAVKEDYTVARTYDIYPAAGKKYSEEKPARICLEIPAAFRKDGRIFRMICVSEDGRPFVLTDLDNDPATVTFETNHFYAFALSYK